MITSQRVRQPGTGSAVRQALGRSLRGLQKFQDEQAYAWERWMLSCRAPQPCTHTPAADSDVRAVVRPSSPPVREAVGGRVA
jgi:hypothetical protein